MKSSKKIVTESDFHEFATCGLRLFGNVTYQAEPELELGERLWKWLTDESFNERDLVPKQVREKFDELTTAAQLGSTAKKRVDRWSPRICKHLFNLYCIGRVVQPVSNYELAFARANVRGEYSVCSFAHRKPLSYIIRLRLTVAPATLKNPRPDLINMARWLHLTTFEPSLPNIRVYNYTLIEENAETWLDVYEEAPVRSMLSSVAYNIADERLFPNVGNHCETCQTAACVQAFNLRIMA